jgi:hypothetical protein
MVRPLGLPVGSVRSLLLLSLAARAILDLYYRSEIAPWLIAALLICGASYFASRQAGPPTRDEGGRGPWWLPTGTIRILFLVLVVYGVVVWFQRHPGSNIQATPVAWVVIAYLVGLVTGALERRGYSGQEAGRAYFEHLLALVSLIAVGGLLYFAFKPDPTVQGWAEPLLAAVVTHYFATR